MRQKTSGARAVFQIHIPIAKLQRLLKGDSRVLDYEINYVNNTLRVEFDPAKITIQELRDLVSD
jgi:hypothetical protein